MNAHWTPTFKSDSYLQADVTAEYRWAPAVHATQSDIAIKDRGITLDGQISGFDKKWTAEGAIRPVDRAVPLSSLRTAAAAVVVLKTPCSSCNLRELCLPCGLNANDIASLDNLGFARRRSAVGEVLYAEGDRFQNIHAVRVGTFKSSLMLADGREQVSGFFMAGELLGLDGVATGRHASTATALEDTEVCAIPYTKLSELAATGGTQMQQIVVRLMSREIVREHSLMLLLGSMTADERLAAFLLNLSQRMKARGFSHREFHLRMSRAEIGSYLGLKLETVSRSFSAFQRKGFLEVNKRHVRINDFDGLTQAFEAPIH
jgi:CRP/FNR family transcriptional regulator